jgi:hypothetical protein
VHPGGINTNIVRNGRHFQDPSGNVELAAVAREFERVARTTPDEAARQIVGAVLRDRPRLLIGADATFIDWMQRLMPQRYDGLIAKALSRRAPAR